MEKTILCVDDEHHGLVIRRMLLEHAGYCVLTAETAEQGLQLFRDHAVDAVVLDFYLPDMDGTRAATAMRLIRPDVPIILFSVQWNLPDEASRVADAVLGKGQSPVALLQTLQALLRRTNRQSA